jgi:hypothetical protein
VSVHTNVASTSGDGGIFLLGSGTGRVKNARIGSNRIDGGTVATLRIENCDNVAVDSLNQFSGGGKLYSVDSTSTEVHIDNTRSPIVTVSASDTYTVLEADQDIICNRAATVTLTLPSPTVWTNRELFVKTIQAQAVVSASSNVAPIGDSALGTAILPATDGAWARLRSNGTSWVIMANRP